MAHGEDHQAIHPLAQERTRQPGEARAEIMPDDVSPVDPKRIQQRAHVPDHARERVVLDPRRRLCPAAAAEVGGDRAEARGHQSRNLVAPQGRGVREAMQQ